jgi:outer membrane protein assembly factor BamB
VEVIRKDLNSILKRGNILICSQRLDLVGIVDPIEEKLVWSWGRGELEGPHHPVLLENGNLLIYDNGIRRGYSQILELNPTTQELVWKYQAAPPDRFFSLWGGANQRLPNGNTLITESDRGRVFEITPSGEIVWEFFIPEFQNKEKRRPTIYRMMRITNTGDYPCLNKLEEQSK